MDPNSIAATSAPLAALCGRCVFQLSQWTGEVISVDGVIADFSNEIRSLENVLRSLEWTLQSELPVADQFINMHDLWVHLSETMKETGKVLQKVHGILTSFGGTNKVMIRRGFPSFRTNLEAGELDRLRKRLNLLIGALNLPIQIINLNLQLQAAAHDPELSETLAEELRTICNAVDGIQSALNDQQGQNGQYAQYEQQQQSDQYIESGQYPHYRQSMQEYPEQQSDDDPGFQETYVTVSSMVQLAHGFTTNASVVQGCLSTTGTVNRDHHPQPQEQESDFDQLVTQAANMSVYGAPLGSDRRHRIMDWIPESQKESLGSSDGSRTLNPNTYPASGSQRPRSPNLPPGASSTLEVRMQNDRLSKAKVLIEEKKFFQAIDFMSRTLKKVDSKRISANPDMLESVTEMQLLLIAAYRSEKQYNEATSLLNQILAEIENPQSPTALDKRLLLAETLFEKGDLSAAEDCALQTAYGIYDLFGPKDEKYYESVRLLVEIYKRLGEADEVELWSQHLPQIVAPDFISTMKDIEEKRLAGHKDLAVTMALDLLKATEVSLYWSKEYPETLKDFPWDEIEANIRERGMYGWTSGMAPIHFLAMAKPERAKEVQFILDQGANVHSTCKITHPRGKYGSKKAEPLEFAILAQNYETSLLLIQRGAKLTPDEEENSTPMHAAANANFVKLIPDLINLGLDINLPDSEGVPPLFYAGCGGAVQAAHLLLQRGANMQCLDKEGRGFLHMVSISDSEELFDLCLRSGIKFDVVDNNNIQAIHHAVIFNSDKILDRLLRLGADINCRSTKELLQPIHLASGSKNQSSLNKLVKLGADVNSRAIVGKLPIHCAANAGDLSIMLRLMELGADFNAQDDNGERPIHSAAAADLPDNLLKLLELGVAYNTPDNSGGRPIHHAAESPSLTNIKKLRQLGGDLNEKTNEGHQPIHFAARSSKEAMINYLLENGANIDSRGAEERTPLLEACLGGNLDTIKVLIAKGADKTARDVDGSGVIEMAMLMKHYDVVKWFLTLDKDWIAVNLIRHSAKTSAIHEAAATGQGALLKSFLNIVSTSWKVNETLNRGVTALHCAARAKSLECVKLLLARGGNVLAADEDGDNALHEANGDEDVLVALIAAIPTNSQFTSTVSRISSLNQVNHHNETPMMKYAERGNFEYIRILHIRYGIPLTARNNLGWTVYHYGAAYGHVQLLKDLMPFKPHDLRLNDHNQTLSGQVIIYAAIRYGKIETAQWLVDQGISSPVEEVRADDGDMVSAFIALMKNWNGEQDTLDALEWLIKQCKKQRPDWIAEEQGRVSPLHEAIECEGKTEGLVKMLIDSGFDVNFVQNKVTAYDLAKKKGYKEAAALLSSLGGKSAKGFNIFSKWKN